MEHNGDDDEESEKDDLNGQSEQNDLVAEALRRFRLCSSENTTTYTPWSVMFQLFRGLFFHSPPPWPKKEKRSPRRKNLVSHRTRIIEYESASRNWINRPRIMYIDAAKKVGPRSVSRLCMMYGIKVQSGVCRADKARAT
jgi:hypothetical protein